MAGAHAPAQSGGPGSDSHAAATAAQFGGNPTGRTRADGLAPHSPAALQADRDKEAKRKRDERAAKRQSPPPPPLPSAAVPQTQAHGNQGAAVAGAGVAGAPLDPLAQWVAEDFRDAAPELVELAEAWRVDAHTKRAVAANLPRKLCDKIKSDAAFPPGAKRSLSTSSPASLAEMFNAFGVPLKIRRYVVMAPAFLWIVVHDLQVSGAITKLIQDEKQPTPSTPASSNATGGAADQQPKLTA